MVEEWVNLTLMVLFGTFLGVFETVIGLTDDRDLFAARKPGESAIKWAMRTADENAARGRDWRGRNPQANAAIIGTIAVGALLSAVVSFTPVGFRWLPFLCGVGVGVLITVLTFQLAKSGKISPGPDSPLDRLVRGQATPPTADGSR